MKNDRIKQLAEQANADADWSLDTDPRVNWYEVRDERFAELVRQDEREACAKLCEIYSMAGNLAGLCATAIRARGEK